MPTYPVKISLPVGKIGLGFKGTPARVHSIADTCPVGDLLKLGQQVIQFSVAGKCEITGFKLPATLLGASLKEYADSPDRVIYIWDDDAPLQPGAPKKLPDGKDVVPGGTWWKRYRDMADSVNLGDGKDASFDHVAVYKEPGENGRWLNKYGSQTRPADEEFEYAIPSIAARMDCTYKVWLPAGKMAASFKGVPPKVSRIDEDSPIYGKAKIGQQIVECADDGEVMMEGHDLTTKSVCAFLVDQVDSDRRTLKFTYQDDPLAASVRMPKASDGTTYKVMLPKGVAGLSFKGVPCKVSRVSADGPMAAAGIVLGQQVVACSIGDQVICSGDNMTSAEVGRFLRDHSQSDGDRILTLTVDSDAKFAREQNALRSSNLGPIQYEVTPPPGALRGGSWLYKEPGVKGGVLNRNGEEVHFAFTILVDI
jgi:hypothetical protein